MEDMIKEELNYTTSQSIAMDALALAALSLSSLTREELTTLAGSQRFQINMICLKSALEETLRQEEGKAPDYNA